MKKPATRILIIAIICIFIVITLILRSFELISINALLFYIILICFVAVVLVLGILQLLGSMGKK